MERGTSNAVGLGRSAESRNVTLAALAHVGFGFGMGLVDALTVMPLLLKGLGAGKVLIGVAWGLASAGWFLLQVPAMFGLGGRPRGKRFLCLWSFFTVVPPYLAIGAAVYLFGPGRPALCMALVMLLVAVRWLAEGASYPFWDDWLARLFGRHMRGRAFGMIAAAMALGGALAAVTAGQVRLRVAFPLNYALLFGGAAVFFSIMLVALYRVREPALPALQGHMSVPDLLGRFGQSLREPNYRSYLIGRILLTFGGGVAAFYAVHFSSPEGGGLSDSTVITLGLCLTAPQAVGSYVLGRMGDRAGHKRSVVIGAVAQVLSVLAAYLGHGLGAAIAAFVLLGVALSASWASHLNMLYETCPHDSRVAHLTVSNAVLSPFLVLVPLGTGWLMDAIGVRAGIGLALVPAVLGAAWMVFVVREPRTLELLHHYDTTSTT
jgi:MFS family permease